MVEAGSVSCKLRVGLGFRVWDYKNSNTISCNNSSSTSIHGNNNAKRNIHINHRGSLEGFRASDDFSPELLSPKA